MLLQLQFVAVFNNVIIFALKNIFLKCMKIMLFQVFEWYVEVNFISFFLISQVNHNLEPLSVRPGL